MMRRIALTLLMILAASSAWAQQNVPVFQGGLVTHGRASYWMAPGVAGDAGSAGAGNITELGITNTGTPFCINDTLTTGPYRQFCLGANALGTGMLNYGAHNGATPAPFTVNTDGPLVLSSQPGIVQVPNLPTGSTSAVQLCISPTTGALSIASSTGCGGLSTPGVLLVGGDTTSCVLAGGDTTTCIAAD